MITDVNTKY